ncbi:tegument protein [Murid herpesvirus 3]|uniref:Tegument protein n=2 Tax=Murid betaherpesvirus 3 TaxID=2560603 RepID=A0A1P8VIQ1_9BETA|nr:tegument protein [Murine roseolovirus]APZ76223.1 tegument protein [Murid betaherpesvirus 3]AYH64746.1 tegument protein [Murid herpesvirus 3]
MEMDNENSSTFEFEIDGFEKFLKSHPHEGAISAYLDCYQKNIFPLPWPVGTYLIIYNGERKDFQTERILWCIATQMCCPEKLIHFGVISTHMFRREPARTDPIVFIGVDTGAVYCAKRYASGGVCRVAESISMFFQIGLVRMYDLYWLGWGNAPLFLEGPNVSELLNRQKSLIEFSLENQNVTYILNYPENYLLKFCPVEREISKIKHPYMANFVHYIAEFGPRASENTTEIIVTGRIYITVDESEIFVREEASGDLTLLASNKWDFLHTGIRPFIENYTFVRSDLKHPKVKCHRCGIKQYNQDYYEGYADDQYSQAIDIDDNYTEEDAIRDRFDESKKPYYYRRVSLTVLRSMLKSVPKPLHLDWRDLVNSAPMDGDTMM